MIRGARASTVPRAVDLTDATRPRSYDRTGSPNGNCLAGAHSRDLGGSVAAEAGSGGVAALESARPGTLVRNSGASAVRSPAAVAASAVGARRLGAAFDISRVAGAGTVDSGTACGGAGGRSHADAYSVKWPLVSFTDSMAAWELAAQTYLRRRRSRSRAR